MSKKTDFTNFYTETMESRSMKYLAERLFYAVADADREANNVDLNREPNAGNGRVDFKLSKGYTARVLVEVKKSSNSDLLNGFEATTNSMRKAKYG